MAVLRKTPCHSLFVLTVLSTLLACSPQSSNETLPVKASITDKATLPVKAKGTQTQTKKPNIVLVFADDLGYGDIKRYNPESLVPTPNLDALASQGMLFTDAHSSSAVCTPSRYSLLTGRYAWRSKLKRGVLNADSPLLIDTKRETLASLLKRADYRTIMVGKWHLGIGEGEPDFSGRLSPGPNALGFDYFYGIPASLDMAPYVMIENEKAITPLKGERIESSTFRRHGGGGKWRAGELGEGFVHEEVLPKLTAKAVEKIHEASKQDQPFFMYFPLTSPHTPWLPLDKYRGTSGAGYYGDFAAYTDGVLGEVTAAIKAAGIEDNTIVIFSSDNGAHWKLEDKAQYPHLANGPWRGQKADIYEAGHRIPLIIKWPGEVNSASQSNAPIVLNDIMRTLASIVDINPISGSATDSSDFSTVLLSAPGENYQRQPMIHHSMQGRFSVRVGDWKLIEGIGSGGFSKPKNVQPKPGQSPFELYNLVVDPAESNNLADVEPERVQTMLKVLNHIRDNEAVEL